ncbi:MAG: cytochrome c biogenesis CcdA family protein [Actinomycetota bacterium]|nr:cytochrome c biogenesis CcdA family protein [Actinomycetota bacterium]MDQ3574764.1 cytochrome c biogenesis CcdA family protein [Actinomycetota bacterium]
MEGALLPVLALAAGLVSITSPCCLPLIPGYVSYVSSLPNRGLHDGDGRRVALRASLLFVLGFTLVFSVMGATASALGSLLLRNVPTLTRAAGVVIIAMGLAALGLLRLPFVQRELRVDLGRLREGPAGAVPLGMAFAFGWTPCIGPVLAGVLSLAASGNSVVVGTALLAVYSLGLGIPFVAMALGYHRLEGSVAFLRRHGRGIERLGGALLVAVGVGYVTGTWSRLFIPLQGWFTRLGWPPI